MKIYNSPEMEIIKVGTTDIVTTSLGTETTPKNEEDGSWDVDEY